MRSGEQAFEFRGSGVGYAQRLIGPELREMAAGPGADRKTLLDVRVAAIAVSINRMAENIVQRLDPLPFELVDAAPAGDEVEAAGDVKQSGPNWGLAMWPGMLLMARKARSGFIREVGSAVRTLPGWICVRGAL